MQDAEVVGRFIAGAPAAAGDSLHIEEDALILAGWWHCAVRLGDSAFLVRTEEAPDDSHAPEIVREVLSAAGLSDIPGEHPLILAVIYTEVSTAGGTWELWGRDGRSATRALASRAGAESMFRDWAEVDEAVVEGLGVQMEGARRIAGLPPCVVLAVGLADDEVYALEASLPACRFESRALSEIEPDDCGDLRPAAVVVGARVPAGREFVMRLRAAACGRFLPVAAVVDDDVVPAGADVALDGRAPATAWRSDLASLLPEVP
ncbi:MAG: hypothetical protein ABR575_01210 [Actinomycetota bacterium]